MSGTPHSPSEADVLIIGAGVAGCAAALQARGDGANRVMLVERAIWPREKVCGCCLNAAGVEELRHLGVLEHVTPHAQRLTRLRVRSGDREATLNCLNGLAISRASLDAMLVQQAQRRGVAFASETSARVIGQHGGMWRVELRQARSTHHHTVDARTVIVADGLNGASLAELPEFRPVVRAGSRMGVALRADGRALTPDLHEVRMLVSAHGYVGLVRLDARTIAVAAALEPQWAKEIGGPLAAVRAVLASAGETELMLDEHSLMGTGLLSRSRALLAHPGLLVAGDAAGYVEPFTGEGMTWGLASGSQAGRMAADALREWSPDRAARLAREWITWHARHIRARHRLCRAVKWCTRHPLVTSATITALRLHAVGACVARFAARELHAPYRGQRSDPGTPSVGAST